MRANPWRLLRSLLRGRRSLRLTPREAYRLWASTYDAQPDNVVLRIEATLFADLLTRVPVEGKALLDFGCGTGRHWPAVIARQPHSLVGADNSVEMLETLRAKFPVASVSLLEDWRLSFLADASIDLLISTLTIGHIAELGRALEEWARVLAPGGQAIVTDFHPEAFRLGLTRTFVHQGRTIEAENHLYPVAELDTLFRKFGFEFVSVEERTIDETVKVMFERQDQIAAYQRYEGTPIVLGLHLVRRGGRR